MGSGKKMKGDKFHEPRLLQGKNYRQNMQKVKEGIEDGLYPNEAVAAAFGCDKTRFSVWKRWALEDREAGYTGTKLQKVVERILGWDIRNKRIYTRKANKIALEDENVDMLKFMLERRHGFKKESKKDVEVSTKDDLTFNLNIVDSKPEKEE